MNTIEKGNAAEAAVLDAFVRRGHGVLTPFGEGQPYDLLVSLGGSSFLRVQCKSSRESKGCVVFNSRSTDHGRGAGTYIGLADAFGVYFPPKDKVYVVPVIGSPTSSVWLRLEPTLNNQKAGIRNAADYEIDQWSLGALLTLVPASSQVPGRPETHLIPA